MTENSARSILRLIAVVVIMVGLSMALYTFVSLLGVSRAMSNGMQLQMSGPLAQMGFIVLLADVAVSALGFALFAVSPKLATKIVA
jgi:uncharacterized membrane protein YidH (DUF202 family)